MQIRKKIIDSTLREGEQTPGVRFSDVEKKNIIKRLAAIGVTEIELGISSPLINGIKVLVDYVGLHCPAVMTSVWSRCRDEDIIHASRLGIDILSLSIPVSELHLCKKLNKDTDWAEKRMVKSILLARQYGLQVSVGFEDSTRAGQRFLEKMALAAQRAGAFRLRIADTVGIASPSQITKMVSSLKRSVTNCEIGVHTHNDFGMATANAMAGFEGGAVWADSTTLGLGERTGCAKLEELVGYLAFVWGDEELHPEMLKDLSSYVSKITERSIAANTPVIGEDIFACETGLHLQGLQKDPKTYEPFDPKRVGAERKLLFGAKSGRKAVLQKLGRAGWKIRKDGIGMAQIKAVRKRAELMNRSLSDAEILKAVSVV